ncbi:MAG: hypothetical protein AAF532_17395 [Planctomycetota bacterium]
MISDAYGSRLKFVPLEEWPTERTREHKPCRFRSGYTDTLRLLDDELYKCDASSVVLQVDLPRSQIKNDGTPYAGARPNSPGVILSFQTPSGPRSFPCDTYDDWQDNLRAIAKSMEALRAVDRYGVTKRGEQYRGFQALGHDGGVAAGADTTTSVSDAWWQICKAAGVTSANHRTDFETVVRKAKRVCHPDSNGGSRQRWDALQQYIQAVSKADN